MPTASASALNFTKTQGGSKPATQELHFTRSTDVASPSLLLPAV